MRHVGLRYANPTCRVPTGSESAKFFDPFFVHFRLDRSRMPARGHRRSLTSVLVTKAQMCPRDRGNSTVMSVRLHGFRPSPDFAWRNNSSGFRSDSGPGRLPVRRGGRGILNIPVDYRAMRIKYRLPRIPRRDDCRCAWNSRKGSGTHPRRRNRAPRCGLRRLRRTGRQGQIRSTQLRESREPRAESREPRAESREPRAESREPRAESREPRAESREPRAESREAEGREYTNRRGAPRLG